MNHDNINHLLITNSLQTIMSLSQTHSLTKTAEFLGVSQSVVSRRISELEKSLGVTLIKRKHRPIQLTTEAREILQHFRQCFSTLPDLIESINQKNQIKPTLRIGFVETFTHTIAPEVIAQLRPMISGFVCLSGTSDRLIQLFVNDELDIIISSDAGTQIPNVRRDFVYSEPSLILMPKGYVQKRRQWTWSQLQLCGLPFINLSEHSGGSKLLQSFLLSRAIHFPNSSQADSTDTIVGLVAQGLGWSIIRPSGIIKNIGQLDSVDIHPFPEPVLIREIYALSRASFPQTLHQSVVQSVSRLSREKIAQEILKITPWLKGQFWTTDASGSQRIALQ